MIIDVDDVMTRELADSLFYPLRQIYNHRQNQPGNYLAPRAGAVGNQAIKPGRAVLSDRSARHR